MTIGIPFTDLAVFSMGEALRMLVLGNLLCDGYRLFLRVSSDGCPRIAGTFDLPAAVRMRRGVLIFPHNLTPKTNRRIPSQYIHTLSISLYRP